MESVNLDLLIAEVDRVAESTDEVQRVAAAAQLAGELQALADDLVAHHVELARNAARSWADIGEALGVTRQAAMQRFTAPARDLQLPLADEVNDAFAEAKQVAIRYRHNYIGTEHLLLGLLARQNSATAAIEHAKIAVEDLRRDTEARMKPGGSQALTRIPWTPYARKAAELAETRAGSENRKAVSAHDWLMALVLLERGTAPEVLASRGLSAVPPSSAPETRNRKR